MSSELPDFVGGTSKTNLSNDDTTGVSSVTSLSRLRETSHCVDWRSIMDLFEMSLWAKATTVPSMSLEELLDFYYNEGFSGEICKIKILKDKLSNSAYSGTPLEPSETAMLKALDSLSTVLNVCMGSYDFRMLLGEDTSIVDWVCALVCGRYNCEMNDFELLAKAPLSCYGVFKSYMKLYGLDETLRLISALLKGGENYTGFYTYDVLDICRSVKYGDFITNERLRSLYDAYITVRSRLRNDDSDELIRRDLNPVGKSAYAYVWERLLKMFGCPDELYQFILNEQLPNDGRLSNIFKSAEGN